MENSTMREASRVLVERVRKLRSDPKIGDQHFEAFIADVKQLGEERMMQEIRGLLTPPARVRSERHPLTEKFENSQARTFFKARKPFIDAIAEFAMEKHGASFRLTGKERTMPQLLKKYSKLLSFEELTHLLQDVATKHAHSR